MQAWPARKCTAASLSPSSFSYKPSSTAAPATATTTITTTTTIEFSLLACLPASLPRAYSFEAGVWSVTASLSRALRKVSGILEGFWVSESTNTCTKWPVAAASVPSRGRNSAGGGWGGGGGGVRKMQF